MSLRFGRLAVDGGAVFLKHLFFWLSPSLRRAPLRTISNVLATLLIIVVTIAALTVALTIISNYIKSRQPRGEIIDSFVVVQRSLPSSGGIGSIKVSLFITCSGPNCDKYTLSNLQLWGYDRSSGTAVLLSSQQQTYNLKHGVTKLDVLGYYSNSYTINEVVVSFNICSPTGTCTSYSKSVSVG
jgi:hypothetical protein